LPRGEFAEDGNFAKEGKFAQDSNFAQEDNVAEDGGSIATVKMAQSTLKREVNLRLVAFTTGMDGR
jgi:hypothetical protein